MKTKTKSLAGLYSLLDDDPSWGIDPVEQCRIACEGGASTVQLRAKHATDQEQLVWGREIRKISSNAGVLFFMNDRLDLALLIEADGVHLGQADLPPTQIPGFARKRLRIGRSTHSEEQVRAALDEGVDYIAFGPVFETNSKASEYSARGVATLRKIVTQANPVPVVAIGGINFENVTSVMKTGVCAVAIIAAIAGAKDPLAATRRFSELADRASG